jgi:hypothetical protein
MHKYNSLQRLWHDRVKPGVGNEAYHSDNIYDSSLDQVAWHVGHDSIDRADVKLLESNAEATHFVLSCGVELWA